MASKQQEIKNTHIYNYLLFVPKLKEQSLPTIIFLHGAGERGDNLEDVKRHGVAKIVEAQAEFPFLVISPQCPSDEYWLVEKLSLLLDEAIATYPIDQNRIYLTGLSMGGYGTWYWGAAEPEHFAANLYERLRQRPYLWRW